MRLMIDNGLTFIRLRFDVFTCRVQRVHGFGASDGWCPCCFDAARVAFVSKTRREWV